MCGQWPSCKLHFLSLALKTFEIGWWGWSKAAVGFWSLWVLPVRGSGRWWSWVHCCASPSRSQSRTPPGPCTGAGTDLRHRAGSSPTAAGPGRLTGSWAEEDQSLGLLQPHRALQHWPPASLHQSPEACLCLDTWKNKRFVTLSFF